MSIHPFLRPIRNSFVSFTAIVVLLGCESNVRTESWDYEIAWETEKPQGVLKLQDEKGKQKISLVSFDWGTMFMEDIKLSSEGLKGDFELFGKLAHLEGDFNGDSFSGTIEFDEKTFAITALKQSEAPVVIDRSRISYVLKESDVSESEKNIDHAGMIADADREAFKRGERIYSSNCINCHGNEEVEGSIPLSTKFWEQALKAGSDSYSMYRTITMGYGSMPPQPVLTPQEKYDVITYIRQEFLEDNDVVELIPNSPGYLAGLPKGDSRGPETKPYQPWADMDYGNFFINTYELVDEETGLERYHSPGPAPYPDEGYLNNNFAYKGIAVRLDEGEGGISKGNAWMIFDHDLMRVAGGWTGKGFIDWNGILLNDKHETYPRTIGKLHFETPVGPGWANPETGSFEDPRFRARDGRAFGPLPKQWADYQGLYHFEDQVILSYRVGQAEILEKFGMEEREGQPIFTRTLNISPTATSLKMRIAPLTKKVAIKGKGARLIQEQDYHVLTLKASSEVHVKLFISGNEIDNLEVVSAQSRAPENLKKYTTGSGKARYPKELQSTITYGSTDGTFAVDQLTPPFKNPWACRMKLSGIDFMSDANKAVVCATDGDIWLIKGLTDNTGTLTWKRIGSGLFQPLGIKVIDDKIYVICRDQLVLLRDFNGDDETDFYESFNHDHQVTDHFHEFAMGLQADSEGNFYYAKSGRHAREALIPQHGTLLKVSKDGAETEIIAKGFRAANGVCINPDGSFLVTDQQGFWNPMNRINWVKGQEEFYGNMWGYDPPKDSTAVAMQPPLTWVDMEFDRSPSELVWVDSKAWGPLNGGLLSFSYGYGKIQWVLHEEVNGQRQGGVIDLPGIKFLTGVMRGRFNPTDGQLYACGMSAWGTNQMLRGGGLYRIRYTGKPITVPLQLQVSETRITLDFATALDADKALDVANYEIQTWQLVRSSAYGSDRHDIQNLEITKAKLTPDGKQIKLFIEGLKPTDVMTISYDLTDIEGHIFKGTVQNTVHKLRKDTEALP